jgi:hypothetical protein
MADIGAAAPITTLELPSNGGLPKAEDLRNVWAAAAKNDDDVRNNATLGLASKVAKAGDTMSGTLTITPDTAVPALILNAATNTTAAAINGNGNAAAVTIVAGASNGSLVAQSSNSAYTIDVLNSGVGGGLQVQGSVGSTTPALNVSVGTAPSATVPKYGIQVLGSVTYLGTPPNADVDVGIDGFVARQNIITSSAILVADGAGGFTVLNNKGFNVLSWLGDANGVVTVNFKRNLPGADYRISILGETGYEWGWNGVQNVGNYQFILKNSTTKATINLLTTVVTLHVSTTGF